MTKRRRTRASKVSAATRRKSGTATVPTGFKVSFGAIQGEKSISRHLEKKPVEAKYFRSDLTKVFLLTMLALALEIALWLYLPR